MEITKKKQHTHTMGTLESKWCWEKRRIDGDHSVWLTFKIKVSRINNWLTLYGIMIQSLISISHVFITVLWKQVTSLAEGGLTALNLVIGGEESVSASFGIKWWHIGRDESVREVRLCIFSIVFMSTSNSSRFLIYFRSSLQQGTNWRKVSAAYGRRLVKLCFMFSAPPHPQVPEITRSPSQSSTHKSLSN